MTLGSALGDGAAEAMGLTAEAKKELVRIEEERKRQLRISGAKLRRKVWLARQAVKKVRNRGRITEKEEQDILAKDVHDEIVVRLRQDGRFQRAFGVERPERTERTERKHPAKNVSKQGVKQVHGIPRAWLSTEVI